MQGQDDPVRGRLGGFGRGLGALILTGVVAAGCSTGPPASVGTAPSAGPASSSASGDQGSAAATAYLAAADAAKAANTALAAQYAGSLTLAQGRAYYRAAADVDVTFLTAVKAITFPPAAAADAATLINRVTVDEALDVRGSTVVTADGMDQVRSVRPADLAAVAVAGNQLRADLGLPAAP